MATYYTYLLSSLPMLHPHDAPPFDYEAFCSLAAERISQRDRALLASLPEKLQQPAPDDNPVLMSWFLFERDLRNELVRERARRKHRDPDQYLRGDGVVSLAIAHAATHAFKITSILEAERFLDQLRWKKFEALEFGHFFDCTALICYAMKLLILLRWQRIRTADAAAELDSVLPDHL